MQTLRKAAIIGTGHVGSHAASSFLTTGLFESIVLVDIDEKKAWGHATDLGDMLPWLPQRTRIYAGGYDQLADADIAVVSACGTYFTEDRLRELDDTLAVMDDITGKLAASGFAGIVLSISNPCDLVAQYLAARTGLRVIGTGTMLDSARLRRRLAQALDVAAGSVQAYCVGEHGDSQVPIFSTATVGGLPLAGYPGADSLDLDAIGRATTSAGWDIVLGKGCTEFGIGAATAVLAQAIVRDEKRILPCSTLLRGEYGVEGVYASVPCVIGKDGVEQVLTLPLSDAELAAFRASCDRLKAHVRT